MSPDLEAARKALAEGRWTEARDAAAAALADEVTPEALEALGWAAWWLDDAETVFASRERAYRLYRRGGDRAAAARMAIWLGVDHLDFHGALAVAGGWLRRARRLLAPLQPREEHGWLAFHEGYLALTEGATARAKELASRAADLGRDLDVPDLEMLGLALDGAARVAAGEIERGMACLDEAVAVALAGEAVIPISGAWACCFLVTACEAVRDYPRAFEWCDRIADFARRYGSRYMLGFCGVHYGAVHLWRGRWADAEAQLRAAAEAYARSRPAYLAEAFAGLAELRRRQGRWAEAERLLERTGGRGALLCRAEIALDRGDAQGAAQLAQRVVRRAERRAPDQAGALELLARASVAAGRLDDAADAARRLRGVADDVGTEPLRAAAELAEGVLAAARAEPELACRLLEDAADRFAGCGAPFEAARARVELAKSLLARGLGEAAARELRDAHAALSGLGAAADARRAESLLRGLRTAAVAELPRVTRRECDVLRALADGLTNRQIAERLVVSEHTVHRHVSNILRKLDLPSRSAAAAYAARAGLLEPPA